MKHFAPTFIPIVLLLLCFALPAWAESETGVEAYKRGDYATALKEFRKLADQGDALGQLNLGLLYAYGQGVPQDYVQAHMWLNLSAAQGNEKALKAREVLAMRMTHAQIAEAQQLARNWKPKK